MLPLPVYYTLLALCSLYALRRGGGPERIGTAIMVVGSVLSLAIVLGRANRYGSVETGVLIIDMAAFAAFTILALRANRFWPIWASALAGLGVLGHLGRWYAGSDISAGAYVVSLVIWSYPILALVAIGTFRHQRRLARFGIDESWSRLPAVTVPMAKA